MSMKGLRVYCKTKTTTPWHNKIKTEASRRMILPVMTFIGVHTVKTRRSQHRGNEFSMKERLFYVFSLNGARTFSVYDIVA